MKKNINQNKPSNQKNRPPVGLSDRSTERPSFAGKLSEGSPGNPVDLTEDDPVEKQEERLKFKCPNIPSTTKHPEKGCPYVSTPTKSRNKGLKDDPISLDISDEEDDDASAPREGRDGHQGRRAPSKGFSDTLRGSSSNSRQNLTTLTGARLNISPTTTSSQASRTPISPVINNAKHPRKSQPTPNPTFALRREKENVGEADIESRPNLGADNSDRVAVNESMPRSKTDKGDRVVKQDHSPVSDIVSAKQGDVEHDQDDNSGESVELHSDDGYYRISVPQSSSFEALDEQSVQDSPTEFKDGAPGPTNDSDIQPSETEIRSDAALLAPWPQCSACKKAGITCDGESPCAACGDPLDCNNSTKSPVRASAACGSTIPSAIVPDYLDPGYELDDNSSEFESDAESVCEISFNLDFFEQQVRTFEKRMLDYQEYSVHRILEQEGTSTRHAHGPLLEPQETSPFARLQPQMKLQGDKFCVQVTDGPLGVRTTKPLTKQLDSNIITVTSDVVSLPRYRSIGRVGPFPLTKNVTVGKSLPYFPDDDKLSEKQREKRYEDLEDKYKSFERFDHSIVSQRRCAEVCAMWRPFLLDLVQKLGIDCLCLAKFFNAEDDYQVDFKDSPETSDVQGAGLLPICTRAQNTICKQCDPDDKLYVEPPWVYQSLWDEAKKDVILSSRQYVIAGLLSDAFRKVTDIKLWHVIKGNESLQESLESIVKVNHVGALQTTGSLCLVCGLNMCPSHGSYQEGDDIDKNTVAINDLEDTSNIHTMVVRTRRTPKHVCGVFCTEGLGAAGTTLRGLHSDGAIRGDFRTEMENLRSTYEAKALCSDDCFWNVEKRTAFFKLPNRPNSKRGLTIDQQQAFESCLELFLGSERGPCMAKDFMSGVSCVNIFFLILDELNATRHIPTNPGNPLTKNAGSLQKARKPSSKHKAMATKTNQPMFLPCDHDGPCQDNTSCSCFQNDLNCEYTCGCDMACDRRYRGCSCRAGRTKVCIEYNCECWMLGRECDPWLCGTCGVTEVLDPANKYRPEIRVARCMHNRLQLGLPARTIKAPSEVQGYGLFAGEDIPEGGFIGEYRGEIISHTEADRRGTTYHLCGYEYLFTLNEDQEIDASNFGNKTRFMNNSSMTSNINVKGATLTCSGVQRVMLSAKRNIKAGEELLYNYSYPEALRAQFWERGQQLPTKNAMTVAPGRKRTSRKGGKMKGVVDSDDDGSRPPVRGTKRKWKDEDNVSDMEAPLPVIEATDESDYEATAEKSAVESESEESDLSVAESSSSEDETVDDGAQRKGRKAKRAVNPGDKRFGGEAQRKAAVTRKKKLGLL